MIFRLLFVAILGIALVGPSPQQGAVEVRDFTQKRVEQWTLFGRSVARAVRLVQDGFRKVARAGEKEVTRRDSRRF